MRNSQSFIITEVEFVFISDRNGLYLTRRCPMTSILHWFFNAFPSFTQKKKKKYRGTRTAQDNQNKNMVLNHSMDTNLFTLKNTQKAYNI